jgi:lysophospholipase L1-like esterase
MGDSITEFWSISILIFLVKSLYQSRISGQTTPQNRDDVIELQPAVVHILAGINDIAGNTGPTTLEMIVNIFRWLNWQKQTKLK